MEDLIYRYCQSFIQCQPYPNPDDRNVKATNLSNFIVRDSVTDSYVYHIFYCDKNCGDTHFSTYMYNVG